MTKNPENPIPHLYTENEVAQAFRCSADTLSRERKRGRIGYTLIGERVHYTDEQIEAYLNYKKVEPCNDNKMAK